MKRQPIIWGIILSFVLILFSHAIFTSADDTYSINYYSYLDLEYDLSPINQPLDLFVEYKIPVTVKYWTNIPDIYKQFESRLTNRFLFDNIIKPKKKISLEVDNVPSWADIYVTSPDVSVDIPYSSDGNTSVDTILIIRLKEDAPNMEYKIDLVASTQNLKRLNGFSYQESLLFTPNYVPSMDVVVENTIMKVDRNDKTLIPIDVTLKGNRISRIKASLLFDNSSYLDIDINPKSTELSIDETGIFNLSVQLNTDFGFFEDIEFYETVEIVFECERYPFWDVYINNSIEESSYFVFSYRQNDFGDFLDSYLIIIIIITLLISIVTLFFIRRRLIQK